MSKILVNTVLIGDGMIKIDDIFLADGSPAFVEITTDKGGTVVTLLAVDEKYDEFDECDGDCEKCPLSDECEGLYE